MLPRERKNRLAPTPVWQIGDRDQAQRLTEPEIRRVRCPPHLVMRRVVDKGGRDDRMIW